MFGVDVANRLLLPKPPDVLRDGVVEAPKPPNGALLLVLGALVDVEVPKSPGAARGAVVVDAPKVGKPLGLLMLP